ncbi:hypothetical protein GWK47_006067 [Chionoecetes opilio]|uniref:Ionotropic glutamate receptor C-terminal domain-containing protein n=1 Tax=Chionoecetes opilio TaxID=41210 RepID=A0A8J5CVL1_CHIOP|nr:hypothetical protein GWK47_006067 [Chionoecetes opilio]
MRAGTKALGEYTSVPKGSLGVVKRCDAPLTSPWPQSEPQPRQLSRHEAAAASLPRVASVRLPPMSRCAVVYAAARAAAGTVWLPATPQPAAPQHGFDLGAEVLGRAGGAERRGQSLCSSEHLLAEANKTPTPLGVYTVLPSPPAACSSLGPGGASPSAAGRRSFPDRFPSFEGYTFIWQPVIDYPYLYRKNITSSQGRGHYNQGLGQSVCGCLNFSYTLTVEPPETSVCRAGDARGLARPSGASVWLKLHHGLVGQSVPALPRAQWQHVFLAAWLPCCLVITTAYTGNLVGILSSPAYPRRLHTLRDLADSDLRLAKVEFGDKTGSLIKNPPNSLYRKGDLFPGSEAAVGAMLAGTHALVEFTYIARLWLQSYPQAPSWYIMREPLLTGSIHCYFRRHTPWKHKFDHSFRGLVEGGLFPQWAKCLVLDEAITPGDGSQTPG